MERRVNQKVDNFSREIKKKIKGQVVDAINSINEKIQDESTKKDINLVLSDMMQNIYDMPTLTLNTEDFAKRKRAKNVVPFYDRCRANRANNEQCTRRKREGSMFCGTHCKGTPHGVVNLDNKEENNARQIQVWAQEIGGILYYIDDSKNIYEAEDIMKSKSNPKIIAKYVKTTNEEGVNVYSIPDFNL